MPDIVSILQDRVGERSSSLDTETINYIKSLLEDGDADEEDLIQSVAPLLESALEQDADEAVALSKHLVENFKGKKTSTNTESTKVLSAPVIMAKIAQEQDEMVRFYNRRYKSSKCGK